MLSGQEDFTNNKNLATEQKSQFLLFLSDPENAAVISDLLKQAEVSDKNSQAYLESVDQEKFMILVMAIRKKAELERKLEVLEKDDVAISISPENSVPEEKIIIPSIPTSLVQQNLNAKDSSSVNKFSYTDRLKGIQLIKSNIDNFKILYTDPDSRKSIAPIDVAVNELVKNLSLEMQQDAIHQQTLAQLNQEITKLQMKLNQLEKAEANKINFIVNLRHKLKTLGLGKKLVEMDKQIDAFAQQEISIMSKYASGTQNVSESMVNKLRAEEIEKLNKEFILYAIGMDNFIKYYQIKAEARRLFGTNIIYNKIPQSTPPSQDLAGVTTTLPRL